MGESQTVSGDQSAERNRMLGAISSYTKALRDAKELAVASQRHDDNMTIWIVSLSTGAVVAVGPVLNSILDFPSFSPLETVLVFAPFVIAILFGMVHRMLLSRVMIADSRFFVTKVGILSVLQFNKPIPVEQLNIEIMKILNDETKQLKSSKECVQILGSWANWISYIPFIMFVLGIVNLVRLIVRAAS